MLPRFDVFGEYGDDGRPIMISNPGQYLLCRDSPRIYVSNVMNIFNPYAVPDVYQTALSIELSAKGMGEFMRCTEGRIEVIAFGRVEVMYTREPSAGIWIMTDKKGMIFHACKDPLGFTRIQNSSDVDLLSNIDELGSYGVASIDLDLRNRPPELIEAVGEMCLDPDDGKRARLFEPCGRHTTDTI